MASAFVAPTRCFISSSDRCENNEKEKVQICRGGTSSLPALYVQRREDALIRLHKGITVCDRRYRFRIYKRCFVGSDAVDYMVQSGWAISREHAVRLGRSLQQEFNLFEHVVEPDVHQFDDRYLFFRFNKMSFSLESGGNGNDSTTAQSDEEEQVSRRSSITAALMGDTKKIGLTSLGQLLKAGVNQKYNCNLDKQGFYADEAVDYMVNTGLANSRSDAESIALALQQAGGVIQNAKFPDQPFEDKRTFFCFTCEGPSDFQLSSWKQDLQSACDFFRENMKRGDHIYRLQKYKNTFTGKEAVDLLVAAGITYSREDAVLLGRVLMVKFNLFGHVADDHEFEDSELFYIFSSKK